MPDIFPGDITCVRGITVGHAQNASARTGVTVIKCPDEGAVGGVSVRGAAPGTRETDLLRPGNLVEKVHAVVLSGGSAFGLDAAGGVMRHLETMGVGLDMGVARVPIVPAAVLYDLANGDSRVRPDGKMGIEALLNASSPTQQGTVGAGTGATVGKMIPGAIPAPGGIGTASITLPEGVTVGAIVAVNACGDVYHPDTNEVLGCGHLPDGAPVLCMKALLGDQAFASPAPGSNTTIGAVAVDCALTKEQANRLADVSHDGLSRTIRPVHTQMDGDTMFALATGQTGCNVHFIKLCAAAAEVTARAIANALMHARK